MFTLISATKVKFLSALLVHTITRKRNGKTNELLNGTSIALENNSCKHQSRKPARNILLACFFIPLIVICQKSVPASKILMVVSSYGKDGGKTSPGFEFDEYSQAYLIFTSNGLLVDVASPKGGNVEPDEYNTSKPYNKTILANKEAMDVLKRTTPTAAIDAAAYDAVYIVGGKGAMFDLPFDPSLQEIITTVYNRKGIISAVCHGPAALVNVKLADGKYLIAGRKVTGFTNQEEIMFGKKWQTEFPFLLEDRLRYRAGIYEKADFMLPQVTVDDQLITGQNPYSTNALAEAVVFGLNKKVRYRKPYADEQTMNLIKKTINEKAFDWAKQEIAKDTALYDLKLMAVYGYYRLLGAKEDFAEVKLGLNIVELTTGYYYNSNLHMERAAAYKKLRNVTMAKQLLEELLQKEPGLEAAKKALVDL